MITDAKFRTENMVEDSVLRKLWMRANTGESFTSEEMLKVLSHMMEYRGYMCRTTGGYPQLMEVAEQLGEE